MRSTLISVIAATAMGLAACSHTVSAITQTQDNRVLNPDSVQGKRTPTHAVSDALRFKDSNSPADDQTDRLRGRVKASDLLLTKPSSAASAEPDCPDNKFAASQFLCRQQAAAEEWDNHEKARAYLESGLTLSNELCDGWFRRLGVTQVSLKQNGDFIASLGTLSNLILDVSKAKNRVSILTNGAFNFLKQNNDNVATNYVVSADLPSVSAAVTDFRSIYAVEILGSTTNWNYYTARRVIMAYDNTCSALFVKRFVNQRVEGGDKEESAGKAWEAAAASFVAKTDAYFDRTLTVAELVDLYAYLYVAELPAATRQELEASLTQAGLFNAASKSIAFKQVAGKPATDKEAFYSILTVNSLISGLKDKAAARAQAILNNHKGQRDTLLASAAAARTAASARSAEVAAAKEAEDTAETDSTKAAQALADSELARDEERRKRIDAEGDVRKAEDGQAKAKNDVADAQRNYDVKQARIATAANDGERNSLQDEAKAASVQLGVARTAATEADKAKLAADSALRAADHRVEEAERKVGLAMQAVDAAKATLAARKEIHAKADTLAKATETDARAKEEAAAKEAAVVSAMAGAGGAGGPVPTTANGRSLETPPPVGSKS